MKKYDDRIFLEKKSTRHHYIPKFFINEFTNADGLLFLYDKQKDIIIKNPRPPKSIFFENDRNTIQINSVTESSILEDLLYGELDNKTSMVINKLQNQDISDIDLSDENTAVILFFIINLFWRIPKTDFAASDLLRRSEIITDGVDAEILRNDPVFAKINRSGIYNHHVSEIIKHQVKGLRYYKVQDNKDNNYVIGDYPFLFRKQPNQFKQFDKFDYLIALNSNRIFSSTNRELKKFNKINSFSYNVAIIHQSVRYIACSEIESLKKAVTFYKTLKETEFIDLIELAFQTA